MSALREDTADEREKVNLEWARVRCEDNLASSATIETCYQRSKDNNHDDVRLSIDENYVNLQAEQSGSQVQANNKKQVGHIEYFLTR
jgi:cell division protein FtsL